MSNHTKLAHTLRQAELHIQHGRIQHAVQPLRNILSLLPKHPQANRLLATVLTQTGQHEAAIRHFQVACEAQPKELQHWRDLLSAYQQTGNVQKARQVVAQAAQHEWPAAALAELAKLANEPPDQRQLHLLAMYQAGKDRMSTEIAARLFIDDYPDHPLGLQILGELLHESGRLEESLDIKQQTVARFPQDANAHNNLSRTLLALKRYKDALASARTALKLNPALVQARTQEQQALAGLQGEATAA